MDSESAFCFIRDCFGSKSPHTGIKRGDSLLRLRKWLREQESASEPTLPTEAEQNQFLQQLPKGEKGKLAAQEVVQSLTFCQHVFFCARIASILSARALGIAEKQAGANVMSNQARDLTVLEVISLEGAIADDALHALDRFAAGAICFQVYCRNRWSDSQCLDTIEFDVVEAEGCMSGFVEARAKHVKQSNRKKKSLFMPLVAPIQGVHPTLYWALEWKKVGDQIGVQWDRRPYGPLMPAMTVGEEWLRRSVAASEISEWMSDILRRCDPSCSSTSSHSMKRTMLGWLSKCGVHGETHQLLSHHSTGPRSNLAYARDVLSGPVRRLQHMLLQVRNSTFHPDATRSGYFVRNKLAHAEEASLGSWDRVAPIQVDLASAKQFGINFRARWKSTDHSSKADTKSVETDSPEKPRQQSVASAITDEVPKEAQQAAVAIESSAPAEDMQGGGPLILVFYVGS